MHVTNVAARNRLERMRSGASHHEPVQLTLLRSSFNRRPPVLLCCTEGPRACQAGVLSLLVPRCAADDGAADDARVGSTAAYSRSEPVACIASSSLLPGVDTSLFLINTPHFSPLAIALSCVPLHRGPSFGHQSAAWVGALRWPTEFDRFRPFPRAQPSRWLLLGPLSVTTNAAPRIALATHAAAKAPSGQ